MVANTAQPLSLGPVHTYPFLFENGESQFSLGLAYRQHVSGENGHQIRIFSKTLSRAEIFEKVLLYYTIKIYNKIQFFCFSQMGFSELIFNTNVDKNLIANYMLNEGNDNKFKKKGYVAMYMFISFFLKWLD